MFSYVVVFLSLAVCYFGYEFGDHCTQDMKNYANTSMDQHCKKLTQKVVDCYEVYGIRLNSSLNTCHSPCDPNVAGPEFYQLRLDRACCNLDFMMVWSTQRANIAEIKPIEACCFDDIKCNNLTKYPPPPN